MARRDSNNGFLGGSKSGMGGWGPVGGEHRSRDGMSLETGNALVEVSGVRPVGVYYFIGWR